MIEFGFFINGIFTNGNTQHKILVQNPANEQIIGSVPDGIREDAVFALECAKNAQKSWAALTAYKRAEYIHALADEIKKDRESLASLLTSEQGKPIVQAREEVNTAINFLTYAAESARRIEGDILTSEIDKEQIWIQRVPFGVTVGICAWNFPLALAARKFGNALVCGNTMVIKPPSETPLTVMKLSEYLQKIQLPKGVLNFITGKGSVVGDELVRNPLTRLVTLTGSTTAGRQLYHAAADNITVLRLELGGKAPFIVMEDADIEKAVQAAVDSRFYNCGQVCTCNERMYIHKSIYNVFKDKFIEKVKALKVGNPMHEDTDIGPKVNKHEIDKLEKLITRSISEGGKVLLGGRRLTGNDGNDYKKGYWFAPTIVEVDNNQNILMQEETFGPIAVMMQIESFDQAIELANQSNYGLSAYLFTNNAKYIMRMVNELECGEVYVNRKNGELVNAFHNGYKWSGVGGEDGKYGLEGYLQKKTVYLNYDID